MTPSEPTRHTPQEFMEGEAGFGLLFPAMEGLQIRPFHFCKKSISDGALETAGEADSRPRRFIDTNHLKVCEERDGAWLTRRSVFDPLLRLGWES